LSDGLIPLERLYKDPIQTSIEEGGEKMKFKIVEKVCPSCRGRRLPCQTCEGLGVIYAWEKRALEETTIKEVD
jgi:hypothetical protein